MKKIRVILVFLVCASAVWAQTHVHTFNERIRTLRVARRVLVLNEGRVDGSEAENRLDISFDEMSHDVHMYSYTVEMTDNSALLSSEYIQGFTTQDITDYEHSINTSREYTHYRFSFPNEEMVLTKSGNYRLTVYEDGDRENKVAEVYFCVVEPLVKIDAQIRSNTDIEFNGRYQQIDIDVDLRQAEISYQPQEFRVVVTQNNRQDNAVTITQPTFIEPKRLRYINNKALIFEGGNEYHHFDAFSTYFAGTGIDHVYHETGDYHAPLFMDEINTSGYIFSPDADGCYLVNAERTQDSDTEAEYMWVHWALKCERPWLDGALYVGGEIFNNELSLRNRMQYDVENKVYWLTALVKQGGYDYQYWFSGKGTQNKTTTQRVDGSFWQTENEYVVYVYWRPFGARYDRLVGVDIKRTTL